jgi:4-hydroxy-2-oxovalerate aldolase
MAKVKLLETTLRDGSYTINYQFNANETRFIANILDEIGFEYIEVGPGTGFNAGSNGKYMPASTDEEYILAAREVVKNGKIGMFFIPTIGRMQDIDLAANCGLDLIRVGTNIDEYTLGFKYIEKCRQLGIETAANLMKSYAVSEKEFARVAQECHLAGAETVYIVDSAGGMLPDDVRRFILETKNLNPDISIGFHGHDNLGLAIANTLEAIKHGAEIVDSSLRGMGRSSGNTITEKLVLVMKRLGHSIDYDLDKMFELSEKIILPYLEGKPESTLDVIYGYSQFHSSFLGIIKKYADKYTIEAKDLIIAYTKIDKISIDEKKLDSIAQELSRKNKKIYNYHMEQKVINKNDQRSLLESIGKELIECKHKYNYKTFFNLTKPYSEGEVSVSPVIHKYNNIAFGSSEIKNQKEFDLIDSVIGDKIDGYLVDSRLDINIPNMMTLNYSDSMLISSAILNYLEEIQKNTKGVNDIYIQERPEIQNIVTKGIGDIGLSVVTEINKAHIAIIGDGFFTQNDLSKLSKLKWVIVTKSKTIEAFSGTDKTIKYIRLSLENEIISEIIKNMNYNDMINNKYGIIEREGVSFCSGGFIGPKGAFVVDDINNIRIKYGISNGDGSINYFEE